MFVRVAALAASLLLLSWGAAPASADEIRLIAAGATKSLLTGLIQRFEAKTGYHVAITTDTAGGVAKRVEAGEPFDLAIAGRRQIDGLIEAGKLAKGSRTDVASSVIGVAVKEGASKPDLSTLDTFRQLLLDAKTIAYVDPASGGTSGIYIAGVIDRLGLTEQLKPKLRLQAGGYVAELVARGEAEIAIHQVSEILPVKGVVLAGEIPREVQSVTIYSLGLPAGASAPARAFALFITGPEAAQAIEAAGMRQPPGS